MASHVEQHTQSTNLFAALSARFSQALSAIAQRMMAYGEARSHYREIQALERLSDAELAGMGLKRDNIVRHALRGQFYL
ncbi:DUF1127 domain-containing protein [Thalassovita mediterranea]|jgi:uncharacterized protein YjiS (DUF1127 family)|uniref:DUF1127 domain-containing protein n=1 Tax=Thalassovita mediterranea TaxID=340021 RepID=A0A0P1GNT6_9RHOB|nr:DUF1127 domain-containing protein [Thalassovita mediterranea]MCG7574174.1 DUF1127 domain-containing protein [Phaeobacter sp. CNT1-3]CUH83897.1 hypothetical protein TM5383_01101 [Thalassovita mediterranea]SIS28177.1 hypothetical protein SAMN05421685_101413 [Thalassovita mediterranea]